MEKSKKVLFYIGDHANNELYDAVSSGGTKKVPDMLHQELAEVDVTISGSTPLIKAASLGQTKVVSRLLHSGADVDEADITTGVTPLISAVKSKNIHVVRSLLKRGANIDIADHTGKTALMYATDAGYTDIVKCLSTLGIKKNVDCVNLHGCITSVAQWCRCR